MKIDEEFDFDKKEITQDKYKTTDITNISFNFGLKVIFYIQHAFRFFVFMLTCSPNFLSLCGFAHIFKKRLRSKILKAKRHFLSIFVNFCKLMSEYVRICQNLLI